MLLELNHVTRSFAAPGGGDPLRVLDDVSFAVASGETVGIVGPSGSGKSTLLHLAGGLDRPTDGRVILEGADLASLNDAARARLRNRRIGFVFQFHHLLPQCTAYENVLIPALVDGVTPEAERRARMLLERVGLADRADHRPGELSGGERQRVAVARALLNRPALVLADEPTGALDRASADLVVDQLLERVREEGLALITVTHAPSVAQRMNRRWTLNGGRLTEDSGNPA